MSINNDNKTEIKKSSLKRIAALVLAILLAALYIMTLVFALTDNPATMSFFRASVALTFLVPILLYSYQLVYRVLRDLNKKEDFDE